MNREQTISSTSFYYELCKIDISMPQITNSRQNRLKKPSQRMSKMFVSTKRPHPLGENLFNHYRGDFKSIRSKIIALRQVSSEIRDQV